jgi:hypothetical protein
VLVPRFVDVAQLDLLHKRVCQCHCRTPCFGDLPVSRLPESAGTGKSPANTGNGMMRRDTAQGKKKPAHLGKVAGFDIV